MKKEFENEGFREATTPLSDHRCGNHIVETIADEDGEFVLVCHPDKVYWQTGYYERIGKTSVAVRAMRLAAEARYQPKAVEDTRPRCTQCGRQDVEWYPSGGRWCKTCRREYDRERQRRLRAA